MESKVPTFNLTLEPDITETASAATQNAAEAVSQAAAQAAGAVSQAAVQTAAVEEAVKESISDVAAAAQQAASQVSQALAQEAAPMPKAAEMTLTPEEQKLVDDFAQKIDVENTAQILQYGAGTQKKMADFSDAALENVRTQDLGEVGNLLAGVVGELRDFDALEEEKGFFGLFKKQVNKIENLKNRYAKAETNVDKIVEAMQEHQIRLLKDSAMLDKMYEENLNYYKELTMYVLAGKKKLQQVRETQLKELQDLAIQTGAPEDAQAARDLADKCDRFEKKLHDLELTKAIAMQTAPQIRLIQSNDNNMVEKIQTTIVNTIPLWKSQMVLALGIQHSAEAAKAQQQVTNLTNELLQKNAEALHTASVETARESERGVVDIETLKKTNQDLINTLDDVLKIQEEGRQKRREAEVEMAKMEAELKAKLLEIHR
ncbi:MAG: toxic anion resistance protein [Blautia sp.]|nr:toxic anion resistance protein [Blautia sp.]